MRATYERIADSYADARRHPFPEVLAFLDALSARSRVLDVGCAHGRHVVPALLAGHAAAGMDLSRRFLSIARSRMPSAGWVQGSATALPFREGAFDACLSISMLHHLPTEADRLAVLREIRRVLRPGGRVLVAVWDKDQPRFRDAPSADVEVPWPLPDGAKVSRSYHLFSDGELERLIITSGLEGERYFRAGDNRFGQATNHG